MERRIQYESPPSSPSRLAPTTTMTMPLVVPTVTPIKRKTIPPSVGEDAQNTGKLKRTKRVAFHSDSVLATSSLIKKISVTGKGTFSKKEKLYQLGGHWNPASKSWDFYSSRIENDDFQWLYQVLQFPETTTIIPYEYKSVLEERYSSQFLDHLYKIHRVEVERTSIFYVIYNDIYYRQCGFCDMESVDLDSTLTNTCGGTWNNEFQKYEFGRNNNVDHQFIIPILLCYRRYITIVLPKNFRLLSSSTSSTQSKVSNRDLQKYINEGIIMIEQQANIRYNFNYCPSYECKASSSNNVTAEPSTTPKKPEPVDSTNNSNIDDSSRRTLCLFSVSGNTFKHKKKLKELGGRWSPKLKKWFFVHDTHKSELQSYSDLHIEILCCDNSSMDLLDQFDN